MVNMRIEKELLDTEMTVVRNEFEMGENSPATSCYERVWRRPTSVHNYGKSAIGNRSDIENVPIDRLAAFYQKYYQPDNAVLTMAGQVRRSQSAGLVAELFGAIPRPQRTLEKTYTVEPTQDGERSVTLRRVGDTQDIMVVYHIPAALHPDDAAARGAGRRAGRHALRPALQGPGGQQEGGRRQHATREELHDPGFLMAIAQLEPDQSSTRPARSC